MIIDQLEFRELGDQLELSARARPADTRLSESRLWFRSSGLADQGPDIDASPFLPVLLLWCMATGEGLTIEAPVSARLLEASGPAMAVCRSFFPRALRCVPVEAPSAVVQPGPRHTAAFFSRGVDSWFSVLEAQRASAPPLMRLVHVPGMDLHKGYTEEQLAVIVGAARAAAERVGLEMVTLTTNVFHGLPRRMGWNEAHGAVLAGSGLALRPARMLIPSSVVGDQVMPLGSHPELDPLFSTEATEVVHHGDPVRLDKIRRVAESDIAMQTLRVCPHSKSEGNCGVCEKCMRTKVELHAVGALDRCSAFDRDVDPARVAATEIRAGRRHWQEARLALGECEFDRRLAAAIELALLRSDLGEAGERMGALAEELRPICSDRSAIDALHESTNGLRRGQQWLGGLATAAFGAGRSLPVEPPRRAFPVKPSRDTVRDLKRARRRAERRVDKLASRLQAIEGSRWWRLRMALLRRSNQVLRSAFRGNRGSPRRWTL